MSTALREIRLYGRLGAQFGRVFHLAVQSPGEAVRALCAVLPGFRAAFLGPDGQAEYHVFVGRGRERQAIDASRKDELVDATMPIRIVPAVAGAKRQGVGQTILGAVLVVVGVLIDFYSYGSAHGIAQPMINLGYAMMIGGVIQMLSPQRRTDTSSKAVNNPSYGMDAGAVNVADAGAPVPIAYGRVICGSVQISAGLSTDEIGATVSPIGGGGGGGGFYGGGAGAGYGGGGFSSDLEPIELPTEMDPYPVDGGSGAWYRFDQMQD